MREVIKTWILALFFCQHSSRHIIAASKHLLDKGMNVKEQRIM